MVLSRRVIYLIYNFENTTLAVVWRNDFERERVKAGRVLRAFFSSLGKRWNGYLYKWLDLAYFLTVEKNWLADELNVEKWRKRGTKLSPSLGKQLWGGKLDTEKHN